jgi:hypothetical protein
MAYIANTLHHKYAVVQVVRCKELNADAWVQPQDGPCQIYGWGSSARAVLGFHLQSSLHQLSFMKKKSEVSAAIS